MLWHLALQTLVLVIDGSVVGRGCVALMMHVVYKGRALPLAWLVRQGKKGHFPEDLHIALVKQVHKLIPLGVQVVLLGDGEFDGMTLQHKPRHDLLYASASLSRLGIARANPRLAAPVFYPTIGVTLHMKWRCFGSWPLFVR